LDFPHFTGGAHSSINLTSAQKLMCFKRFRNLSMTAKANRIGIILLLLAVYFTAAVNSTKTFA
jgi:hypothetical protein